MNSFATVVVDNDGWMVAFVQSESTRLSKLLICHMMLMFAAIVVQRNTLKHFKLPK